MTTLFSLLETAFDTMRKNVATDNLSYDYLQRAVEIEERINQQRNEMRRESNEQANAEGYNVYSALIYTNLFSALERIGDHLLNVSESLMKPE